MIRKITYLAILLLTAIAASPAEVAYTYNLSGATSHGYGFGKEETYDVAIRLSDASLVGSKIIGIKVALPGAAVIKDCSGWLSEELSLKRVNGKYVNNPDICVAEATVEDGILEVRFDKPYQITTSLYAGYSFTVASLNDETSAPVMVADGDNADGLYIHSSRTKLKWMTAVDQANGVSAMSVLLDGDFRDNSATFSSFVAPVGSAEAPIVLELPVINHGLNAVTSVSYSYQLGDRKGSSEVVLPKEIPAVFGSEALVTVDLGNVETYGDYELKLTVDKVNGADNGDVCPTKVIPLKIYPFIPVNRPLLEEYTGLWCGYCPRGFVAMETLKERYPDRFVGIAYHCDDDLSAILDRPSSPGSYPSVYMNREEADCLSNIYTAWPNKASLLVPASVDVTVEWSDDAHSGVTATSEVRMLNDYDTSDFRMEYVLVIDGLTSKNWRQANYFAPKEGEEPIDRDDMPGEWGRLFTHGTDPMRNLIYNDVPLAKTSAGGITGSVPSHIVAGERYTHKYSFNLNDDLTDIGRSLIQNKNLIRVIAILVDSKTGRAVNCASSPYMDPSAGAAIPDAGSERVVSSVWYDVTGRKVDNPAGGIFIRVDIFSDGSMRTTKHLVVKR